MTELERYLAEEVAEDHVDGIITRREAMRRLGLLGLSTAAASAMIATEVQARSAGKKGGDHGHHHGRDGRDTAWAPVATEAITFQGPPSAQYQLMGAWAPAAKSRGGVLVIHENRGLTAHISTLAGRFAASGWSALALDLLSSRGGTGAFPDEGQIPPVLASIPPAQFDAEMKAGLTELSKRVGRRAPLAAIGFCFGGGMVWRLLASREPRLAAAAPFYGPFPEGGSLKGNKADVLGVYGGLDTRINATRDAARAALEAAKLDYELLTFTLADHAFFNDTGARFNPHAATEAWRRVIDWFDDATRSRPPLDGPTSVLGRGVRSSLDRIVRALERVRVDLGVVGRREADRGVGRPPAAGVGRAAVDDREVHVGGQRGAHEPDAVGVAEPVDSSRRSRGRGWNEPIRRHTTDSPKRSQYIRPSASPNTFDAP